MSELIFDSRTPRHDLPYLFAGQAQKEGFVNEALARIDALLHMVVEAVAGSPPEAPADGDSWLIAEGATGDWSGRDGMIATAAGGNWLFFAPRTGMRVLNRTTGHDIRFVDGWQIPIAPDQPAGGGTVDAESRTAIAAIIAVLAQAGLLASAA